MDGEEESGTPPRPIDDGLVDQSIVEYMGNKMGTFTCRPSGREYRFSASPRDKRKYVLNKDLVYFRRLPDFRILEEGRIDREAEERQRREAELAELRAQVEKQKRRGSAVIREVSRLLDDHEKRGQHHPPRKPGGRPAGRGLGALLDCWMTCGCLEGYHGTPREAYGAIHRYLREHATPGGHVPPRERLASMRSDAKRKREKAGLKCLWHNHPEPVPPQLNPTDHP